METGSIVKTDNIILKKEEVEKRFYGESVGKEGFIQKRWLDRPHDDGRLRTEAQMSWREPLSLP